MKVFAAVMRWLLVPVSAIAIAALGFAIGRWIVSAAGRRCAPELHAGGACVESWHTGLIEAVVYAGLIVTVPALIIVPVLIAPALRRTLAIVVASILLGSFFIFYRITGWAELLTPFAVAALCAAVTLWWIWSRSRTAP